jgi:hypothetical protein
VRERRVRDQTQQTHSFNVIPPSFHFLNQRALEKKEVPVGILINYSIPVRREGEGRRQGEISSLIYKKFTTSLFLNLQGIFVKLRLKKTSISSTLLTFFILEQEQLSEARTKGA